jgi:hypothetical protein
MGFDDRHEIPALTDGWHLLVSFIVENETMSTSVTTKEKVEELKQDAEIQKALDQTAAPEQALSLPSKRRHKFFLTTMQRPKKYCF